MREVTKKDSDLYSNRLDPGKPYLVLDQNTGRYHILYWVMFYSPAGAWTGGDWCDTPTPASAPSYLDPHRPGRANSHPKPFRVWEVPEVAYARPAKSVDGSVIVIDELKVVAPAPGVAILRAKKSAPKRPAAKKKAANPHKKPAKKK